MEVFEMQNGKSVPVNLDECIGCEKLRGGMRGGGAIHVEESLVGLLSTLAPIDLVGVLFRNCLE